MATSLTQIPTNKSGFIVGRYRLRHLDEHYSGGLGGIRWENGVTQSPVEGHHLRRMVAAAGNQFSLEPWDAETASMPEVQAKGLRHPHFNTGAPAKAEAVVCEGMLAKGAHCAREATQSEAGRLYCDECAGAVLAEPSPKRVDDVPRCEVCDWPLAEDANGCTGGLLGCSYRPAEGTDEYERIQRRRAELEAAHEAEQPSDGADTEAGSVEIEGEAEPEASTVQTSAYSSGAGSAVNLRAPELEEMTRSQLRDFAREQGIADKVDLRQGRDDLEADIRRVLAGE